jgi:hypothetical protein
MTSPLNGGPSSSLDFHANSSTDTSQHRSKLRGIGPYVLVTLVLTAILLALPYQSMPARRLVVGSEESAPVLAGFSFPEVAADGQSFRWSEDEGTILFPDVANRPLLVRLYMHAMRPTTPPTVTVALNDRVLGSLPVGGTFAEYTVRASRATVGWDGRTVLTIRVPPFTAPPDTRQLGVAVAWAEIAPAGGPAIPPAPVLLKVVLPLLLAALGMVLFGSQAGLARWVSTLLGLAVSAGAALVLARRPSVAVHWAWLIPIVVWGVGAVILLGPKAIYRAAEVTVPVHPTHLARVFEKKPLRWLIIIASIAIVIYLPLARTTGYWGDIEIYMAWTHQITHFGIHSAYGADVPAAPNTTPGLLYPFWIIGQAFRNFFSPDFPQPWVDRTNQAYLRFMLRLPALLCTALIATAAALLVRRRWGVGVALVAAAAYVFNPAVIFESAYYGQTGAVHTLFMLLGVVGLAEGYPAAGWAALAAGMLTKPQADIFLPLFIIYTWRRYGFRATLRSGFAALIAGLVLLAPFILRGTLNEMWARISHVADYHPVLSATAHNVWWLASLGNGKASDLLMPPLLDRLGWPIFTYRAIGLALVGLAYLVVLVRILRDTSPRTLYLSAAFLFLSFFMLATQIHENHLIPMFPLLLLACIGDPGNHIGTSRKLWLLYGLFAITATLNMALHYPEILRVLVPQNPDVWGGREMAVPRWLNSLAQVSLFVYFAGMYVRETFEGFSRSSGALGIRKTQ